MCFWFQQFLPPTILATFVLLIVGSRSIFSQPADNYELCEGKIRGTKHCASKEIRWYHSLLLYTPASLLTHQRPELLCITKKSSKELFFWGHKIDLLKNHMVCFDKIPSLLYWDGNGGKRTLLWWMEAKRFTENLILCWKSLWSTYWPKHDQWAYEHTFAMSEKCCKKLHFWVFDTN